jgi:hypothetical protein
MPQSNHRVQPWWFGCWRRRWAGLKKIRTRRQCCD